MRCGVADAAGSHLVCKVLGHQDVGRDFGAGEVVDTLQDVGRQGAAQLLDQLLGEGCGRRRWRPRWVLLTAPQVAQAA